jgi:hypothetical protein
MTWREQPITRELIEGTTDSHDLQRIAMILLQAKDQEVNSALLMGEHHLTRLMEQLRQKDEEIQALRRVCAEKEHLISALVRDRGDASDLQKKLEAQCEVNAQLRMENSNLRSTLQQLLPPPDEIIIFIKFVNGDITPLQVDVTDRVADVKWKISDIPPDQRRLFFRGIELDDDTTIQDSSVENYARLHFVPRLPEFDEIVALLATQRDFETQDTPSHIFVLQNGRNVECRFPKNTTAGEAAAVFGARSIRGISGDTLLDTVDEIQLVLCPGLNIKWHGTCFASRDEIQVPDCPRDDERYVHTIIGTNTGLSHWYERQQKLRMTVNDEEREYALTGAASLAGIRGWFERKANVHCEVHFFREGVEIDQRVEEEVVALGVPGLSVKVVRKEGGREWAPSPTQFQFQWTMVNWSDQPEEGWFDDLPDIGRFQTMP